LTNHARKEVFNTIRRTCQFVIKAKITRVWFNSWATHLRKLTRSSMTQTSLINRQRLKMHQSLREIESFLITQIKSKKIDLTSFFFRRRVLDIFSSIYFCDWHQQTVKHIIMFCNQFDRETLKRELNINDYKVITSTSRTLRTLVSWFMQLKLLSQFSLTRDMLYD
jgi:hypothetical protein